MFRTSLVPRIGYFRISITQIHSESYARSLCPRYFNIFIFYFEQSNWKIVARDIISFAPGRRPEDFAVTKIIFEKKTLNFRASSSTIVNRKRGYENQRLSTWFASDSKVRLVHTRFSKDDYLITRVTYVRL